MRSAFLVAAVLAMPGCYLSHGLGDPLDAPTDGARTDVPRTDAGPTDVPIDVGPPDAGPPRPLRWVSLAASPGAVRPPARYGHYAVIDEAGDRMIVFGGIDPYCCGEWVLRTDVWALDLGAGTWEPLGELSRPVVATSPIEPALDPARNRIVLASTVHEYASLSPQTVGVDLSTFEVNSLPGGPWEGTAVRAAFDSRGARIVVNDAYFINRTEGVWIFDLRTDTWQTLAVEGTPGQLFHAPLTLIGPDRAIVYSGFDGDTGTTRIWQLDLSTRRFERLAPSAEMGGRFSHRAVFEPTRGTLVVVGGSLFTVDRGTLLFDVARGTLETPTLVPEAPPRRDYTLVFDAARRRAIAFGGAYQSERALDDTWALELP